MTVRRYMMQATDGITGRPTPMWTAGPAYFRCDDEDDLASIVALMLGDLAFVISTGQIYVYNDSGWSALGAEGDNMNPIDAWPIGSIFLSMVATSPTSLLGGGTWERIAVGKMIVGQDDADTDFDVAGDTGGSKTHSHANHANHVYTPPNTHVYTHPNAHPVLAHAGVAVANHVVTQPAAHANHVVTQPADHAAHTDHPSQAHSAAATPNLFTTNTASSGTGPAAHPALAHSAHSAHTGAAVDAHSAHTGTTVDAHVVTQPNDHAAQSHSGGGVDAHSGGGVDAHSAHSTANHLPPFFTVYIWQRTA